MQVEGSRPGETAAENIYIDEETFNGLLDSMNYSADYLTIPDEAFDHYFEANGTNTIGELNSIWKQIQKMSNRYKTFMSVDVSGAFLGSIDKMNEAAKESGNAINNS